MSVKSPEYRAWRVRNHKSVNWQFVRGALRYRQEVRDLRKAGFVECRSFTALPFDDQGLDSVRIAEARIADNGKALWVRLEALA